MIKLLRLLLKCDFECFLFMCSASLVSRVFTMHKSFSGEIDNFLFIFHGLTTHRQKTKHFIRSKTELKEGSVRINSIVTPPYHKNHIKKKLHTSLVYFYHKHALIIKTGSSLLQCIIRYKLMHFSNNKTCAFAS